MAVDYVKVKKIFLEVLEQPPGQNRRLFVEEACGTDVDLRNFVLGMLDLHEKHVTPIPQGPTKAEAETQGYSAPALTAGTIIGDRYKIIELIAEGGMGSVYRASRISDMKMEVAIKVIKPGMDSQQVLARFNVERQALALMKHENIARVLDAGMTDQRLPYFVMELVKGLSLTKFCDESKLSIPQRLELFVQICSAVQHAHQKGIVHRDLKPSNILVALFDDKPVPKVIDFGLAKALHQPLTDDEIKTRFGTFVGTWQYTAPEQAKLNNLDIDTRADIYSLGVILYELLTGTTPVEKQRLVHGAYLEVLRIIQEEEPQKPSTKIHSSNELPNIAALRSSEPLKLEKLLRGELDWIVMKALDKDRNRRYPSANDFAADIHRYMLDEPVQAGPPTFRYKAGKFLRKHRGTVLVAALLIATALVGAIVSTIGWIAAVKERNRADANVEIAQATTDFLTKDLLEEADPSVQIKPGQNFVSNLTVKKALDHAADNVGSRFTGKPLIEAAIRHAIGKTYLGIGDLQRGKKQLQQAEQLRLQHQGAAGKERLQSLHELAWAYNLEDQFPKAEELTKEVIQLRMQTLGAEHQDTLQSKYLLGVIAMKTRKPQEVKELFEETWKQQQRTLGPQHKDTLLTQRELAGVYLDLKDYAHAEQCLQQVLDVQNRIFGSDHPETFVTINTLALLYSEKGDHLKAEETQRKLVARSEVVLGKLDPRYLSYSMNLSGYLAENKKNDEALPLLEKLLPLTIQVHGNDGYGTLALQQNRIGILCNLNRLKEAETLLVDTYQRASRSLGDANPLTVELLESLIRFYTDAKRPEEVLKYKRIRQLQK